MTWISTVDMSVVWRGQHLASFFIIICSCLHEVSDFSLQGMEHPVTNVSSSDLEKAYLAYCTSGSDAQAATLKFQAGKHKYELDFRGTSWPTALSQQGLAICWLCLFHINPGEALYTHWGPGKKREGWSLLLKYCPSGREMALKTDDASPVGWRRSCLGEWEERTLRRG